MSITAVVSEKGLKMETHQEDHEIRMFKTRNYAMFTPNPENRPIEEEKVEKLFYQITHGNNQLSSNPITVDENLMIAKGHHRHAAAEKAQVDLYYIIIPGANIQQAIDEDSLTDHWTTKQHIKRFANLGRLDFVLINNFWKEYDWLTVSNLIRLCSTTGYKKAEFPKGKYKADRMVYARKICDMAMDFKPYFREWNSKTFLDTLVSLASNQNYHHTRMIRKMRYQASKLTRQATVKQYLDLLTEIYNNREAPDHHVYFHPVKQVKVIDEKK